MKTEEVTSYTRRDGNRQPMSVFPLNGKIPLTKNGYKDATKDQTQIEYWWNQYPAANIGIPTGTSNGLLVVDVDINPVKEKSGDKTLLELEKELGVLPNTWEVITGTGGRHLYFRYPDGFDIKNSASKLAKDIDVRAIGGYVVAPPSIHPDTGKEYVWKNGASPRDIPLAELPRKWLQELLAIDIVRKESHYVIPERVLEGTRNESIFKYGASLRGKNVPALGIMEKMRAFNYERCHPPLPDRELQGIYDSIMRYPAGTSEGKDINSKYLSSMHQDIDLSQFHIFNEKGKPTQVFDNAIFQYITQSEDLFVLGAIPYIYSHGVYVPDLNGAKLKTAIKKLIYPELIKSTTIDRIYKLFITDANLQVAFEDLNNYPSHWINFKNSFYDPKEKKLIPHDPKYRAINQIPHVYSPDSELSGTNIEEWLDFIAPDNEDRQMLLEYCGYCLTADTREQKFMILYGAGGSGKSTVINLVETMVGTNNISNISLKELNHRFATFGLMGKLLNSCADLEVSALEDTSVIKKILGEDSIRAEAKGKDAFSFKNYSKLIFSTNELPLVLSEKTNGFYRRLLIINMSRQPEVKITDYLSRLKSEVDYFISLSVKALGIMYERGHILESVNSQKAVKMLRDDSDSVEAWINEECTRDTSTREDRTVLYNRYYLYCIKNDRTPLQRANFYRALIAKDFAFIKSNGSRCFIGLKIGKSSCAETNALSDDNNSPEPVEIPSQLAIPFD